MGCTTSTPAQPPMIQSLEVSSKESKGIVFTDNIIHLNWWWDMIS